MARPPAAGELRDRVSFQVRGSASDGFGTTIAGAFSTQFSRAARMMPLRGGEEVIASRLAGKQPYIVTVRRDSETATVTPDWRMVDARDSTRIFNITAISDPDGKRRWLDMMVVEGGPGGE